MRSIDKFNFNQLFNNSKGKTSLALVVCAIIILFSLISMGFAYAIIFINTYYLLQMNMAYVMSVINVCVGMITTALAVITTRRFTKDKEIEEQEKNS